MFLNKFRLVTAMHHNGPLPQVQKSMVEYLESVHQGEFFDGKLEEVIERIDGLVVVGHCGAWQLRV